MTNPQGSSECRSRIVDARDENIRHYYIEKGSKGGRSQICSVAQCPARISYSTRICNGELFGNCEQEVGR